MLMICPTTCQELWQTERVYGSTSWTGLVHAGPGRLFYANTIWHAQYKGMLLDIMPIHSWHGTSTHASIFLFILHFCTNIYYEHPHRLLVRTYAILISNLS